MRSRKRGARRARTRDRTTSSSKRYARCARTRAISQHRGITVVDDDGEGAMGDDDGDGATGDDNDGSGATGDDDDGDGATGHGATGYGNDNDYLNQRIVS